MRGFVVGGGDGMCVIMFLVFFNLNDFSKIIFKLLEY